MTQDSRNDPTDVTLQAVMDRRRRQVLRVLIENDGAAIEVDQLVADLTERIEGEGASSPDAEQLEFTLYHAHLPILDDAGMIEYDERSQTIRYRPDERVERIIRVIEEELG